ncbi:MAG: hypothetical protein EBR09_13955 [Proteobacteria bacterium]|nr:hypothetical protein [Pseudomonadota bacterium]
MKKSLLSAAAVGMASGVSMAEASAAKTNAPAAMEMHTPKDGVQCFGTNTCKGTATCAVTKEQIRVANEVFKNKFMAAKPHDCGSMNTCGASTGNLDWVKKASAEDCFKAGGFIFEKATDKKSKKPVLTIKKA